MPKDDIGGGNIIGKTGYIDQNDKYVLGDHVYTLEVKGCESLFLHSSIILIDFSVRKDEYVCNITATLSAFRGIAQPWRFFLAYSEVARSLYA